MFLLQAPGKIAGSDVAPAGYVRALYLLAALALLVGSAAGTVRADPDLIPLPSNFTGEGLAIVGSSFYVGSLGYLNAETKGEILTGDLTTGSYQQFAAPDGLGAAGDMHFDARTNLLYVSRNDIGGATVYDATTGAVVRSYQFNLEGVNDQVITRDAVYFTNLHHPELYRVPLGPDGQPGGTFETISLPANFGNKPAGNGIVATADGRYLIVGHTAEGNLYRIDTSDFSDVRVINYGGPATNDGLLLDGNTLYDVQNLLNRVAIIHMSDDFLSGYVTGYLSNPQVQVPTSVARYGDSLYVVAGLQGAVPGATIPPYVARLTPLPAFRITAASTAVSGTPFDVTVTALDASGNIDTTYQGTVTFTTTDPDSGVVLPADYTFTTGDGGDNGVHTFPGGVTLVTVGDQTLTATDTVSGSTGSATITVGPGP